jgi:hypothetical protein
MKRGLERHLSLQPSLIQPQRAGARRLRQPDAGSGERAQPRSDDARRVADSSLAAQFRNAISRAPFQAAAEMVIEFDAELTLGDAGVEFVATPEEPSDQG